MTDIKTTGSESSEYVLAVLERLRDQVDFYNDAGVVYRAVPLPAIEEEIRRIKEG